jgi:hypothetical protein
VCIAVLCKQCSNSKLEHCDVARMCLGRRNGDWPLRRRHLVRKFRMLDSANIESFREERAKRMHGSIAP